MTESPLNNPLVSVLLTWPRERAFNKVDLLFLIFKIVFAESVIIPDVLHHERCCATQTSDKANLSVFQRHIWNIDNVEQSAIGGIVAQPLFPFDLGFKCSSSKTITINNG